MTDQLKLGLAALALVAAFGSGWLVNGWRLGERIERLEGENARLKDANEGFASAVREQTKAIQGLRADADRREAEGKRATEEARKRASALAAQVSDLLKRPLPKDPSGDCPALEGDLNEAIRARRGS